MIFKNDMRLNSTKPVYSDASEEKDKTLRSHGFIDLIPFSFQKRKS